MKMGPQLYEWSSWGIALGPLVINGEVSVVAPGYKLMGYLRGQAKTGGRSSAVIMEPLRACSQTETNER